MARSIRIEYPGDGAWIMDRAEGVFTPEFDHVFMSVRDGARLGGFALCGFLGGSITVHMAGDDPRWCSRDLMWMVFHYAFVQLGVRKVLALVRSNNHIALAQDLRAGFAVEAMIQDAYPDAHMMVLSMSRDTCRWLRITPSAYAPVGAGSNNGSEKVA